MKLAELFERENFVSLIDEELKFLMVTKPDFVYSNGAGCFYHQGPSNDPDRCTGCIFGQSFQLLGVQRDELKRHSIYIRNLVAGFGKKAPVRWRDIQLDQDRGMRWGDLLQHFE